jgi:ribosomal protein L11 methyltransferase
MNYIAFHFTVAPPQPGSEILVALISDLGFESFDYNDSGFTAYIQEQEPLPDLSEFVFDDFTFTFKIEKIAPTNWNAEWEKNFEPVIVDDLLCIRAPFHKKNSAVKLEIEIMPKMSFGTGHHQTTRLMCRELFNLNLTGKRVLDMGCGTGILAILAKMLKAGEVVGIDIDAWSVENATENALTNGFPDIILKKGDVDLLEHEKAFDVILANINKNILKTQLPAYSKIMNSGTTLFLSGFFLTDADELRATATTCNFETIKVNHENEWAMLVLEKQ